LRRGDEKLLTCARGIIKGSRKGAAHRGKRMPQTYTVGARSLFVTLTAWVFILVATFATATAVVQNVAAGSLLAGLKATPGLPLVTSLLVGYLPWVVGAGLVLSVATLAAAVGLLMRLDWARRAFIGLLVVAIVANIAGLWLQHELVQSLVSSTLGSASLPANAQGVFGGFVAASRLMAALVTLGACAMLAWVIRRLMSPMVRQEFA
jgi:hypothetical protein